MREKLYHTDLKKVYLQFDKIWFKGYSFLNLFRQYDEYNASDVLKKMLKMRIVRGKNLEYSKELINTKVYDYNLIEMQSEWKITSKGLYELKFVYPELNIELTKNDYIEYAKEILVE
jgi:hypothetical protein